MNDKSTAKPGGNFANAYLMIITAMTLAVIASACSPAKSPTPPDIISTWHGLGGIGLYHQFNEDGTCHIARSLENIADRPDILCAFHFEGAQLILEEVEASRLTPCGNEPGIYEVRFLEMVTSSFY